MLIGEGFDWLDGVERAWEMLCRLNATDVCRRTGADFDQAAGHYVLPFYNERVFVSPLQRKMWGDSPFTDLVLNELAHYSMLSVLWYLLQSQNIPPAGNLVHPREMEGGLIFTHGSHVLPLDRLTERYGGDIDSFIGRALTLGAERMSYADASVRLLPFPRIPVALLIWQQDEEFSAHADIPQLRPGTSVMLPARIGTPSSRLRRNEG